MKILVVHHVRGFESTTIYLNDDFKLANEKLFGAQELDTWAGVRLLAVNHITWRLEICPNLGQCRFIDPNGRVVSQFGIQITRGIRKIKDLSYLASLIRYLDTSIAYFANSTLKKEIKNFVGRSDLDLLWWETQFYDALIPSGVPSIVRSVNFEAKHVLAEDSSGLRWIRSLGKLWSERLISKRRVVVAISPSDRSNYLRLGSAQIYEMPLRQLSFLINTDFQAVENPNTLMFFGSSFDVRHNRRNLESLALAIAPLIEVEVPEVRIASFGHRIPADIHLPPNMQHFGFIPNLQGMQIGCLGVIVPFNGGAGMQSKIFEPLCLGVPIIANPKNFAGYPFVPGIHYLSAKNPREYVEAVKYLLNHPKEANEMSEKAKFLAEELFNSLSLLKNLDQILNSVSRTRI
jgi:glycosyltransferase involved in cell wall biosynthesis